MISIDALADAHYAAHDPQNISEEQIERADMNDAIDELVDLLSTAVTAFDAVKDNFTTRQFNKYILALEEMANEVKGLKDD